MMNHICESFMLMPTTGRDKIAGLLPDATAAGAFPVFRIIMEFKKAVRRNHWRSLRIWITGTETGLLPFEVSVVRATGLRINDDKHSHPKQYSFCIDERIFYQRLISRPSLGLSPPVI